MSENSESFSDPSEWTSFAPNAEAATVLAMVRLRRTFLVQTGAVLGVLSLFFLSRSFPIADWLGAAQEYVMGLGFWSAICYPLLYACCNVLLLPGGVLSIGGGFFFGLWWGFLITLLGNMIGAAIAFCLSRYLGKAWLERGIRRNRTLQAIGPAVEREGWKIILLSQLHPFFPTSLLNYLYGLTTIRFRTCMLWIAIGQAPGLFLYAYLGTLGQLGLRLVRGQTHPHPIEYVLWTGGLALSFVTLMVLGRIALRVLKEAQETYDRSDVFGEASPELVRYK